MNELEIIKTLLDAKIHLIPIHTILEDGSCSCHKGKNCPSKGKHPKTPNGLKDATNDFEKLKPFLGNSNWAIVTGKISGLEVLDIDPKNDGIESLKKLLIKSDLYTPNVVLTGSGGLHLYYSYSGEGLKNRTNILPGIDFKTDNGYVVCPPSIHLSGNYYKFLPDFSFDKYLGGEYEN